MTGKDDRSTIDVYKRQGASQVHVECVICAAAACFSERMAFHNRTVPEAAKWARTESAHQAAKLKFEYLCLYRDAENEESWWAKLFTSARQSLPGMQLRPRGSRKG